MTPSALKRTSLHLFGSAIAVAIFSGGNFYLSSDADISSGRILSDIDRQSSRSQILSDSFTERNMSKSAPTTSSRRDNTVLACHPRNSLPCPPLPGKRGIGLTLRKDNWKVNIERVKELNVSWNYSWGSKRIPAQPDNVEFMPMVWGGGKNSAVVQGKLENDVLPEFQANRVHRLLAFNEPDNPKQSNLDVDTVVNDYWPLFEKVNIPLASPSVAHATGNWTKRFFQEADQKGLRMEYTAVHWYGGANAQSFKRKMIEAYESYGRRPLLITEFAVADWDAGAPSQNKFTSSSVLDFMKVAIPWLEQSEFVAGYAWFNFSPSFSQGSTSALYDDDNRLTACGRYYASVNPDNPMGDQSITVE